MLSSIKKYFYYLTVTSYNFERNNSGDFTSLGFLPEAKGIMLEMTSIQSLHGNPKYVFIVTTFEMGKLVNLQIQVTPTVSMSKIITVLWYNVR